MKSLPITHKATRSPLKLSAESLVENDRQVHKQFNDVAKDYAAGRKEGISMTQKKGSQRPEPANTNPPVDLKQPIINAKDKEPAKTV